MIAAIITAISCVFGFAACVPEQEKPTQGIPKEATEGLMYAMSPDKASYVCTRIGIATNPDIVIPSVYNGLPVTEIGEKAFYNSIITGVVIPENVTVIREEAFYGCYTLSEITLPESLTVIEEKSFYGCMSLDKLSVPGGVTDIEDMAFAHSSITELTFSGGVKHMGSKAFGYCSMLKEVALPEGLEVLDNAFNGCTKLERITLLDSLTEIAEDAFADTPFYENLKRENGVIYIGNILFEADKDMEGSYTVKSGTKLIADMLFTIVNNSPK